MPMNISFSHLAFSCRRFRCHWWCYGHLSRLVLRWWTQALSWTPQVSELIHEIFCVISSLPCPSVQPRSRGEGCSQGCHWCRDLPLGHGEYASTCSAVVRWVRMRQIITAKRQHAIARKKRAKRGYLVDSFIFASLLSL